MAYNPECLDCSEVDPVAPVIPPVQDPPGGGLPPGGTTGQVLTKASDADGDAVWASGGGGGTPVIVDAALSTTSTNPVQNRVITNALNGKASQASLDALSTTVGTKASQADLEALETTVDGKVDKVTGKGLSTNDYTDADKAIVDGVTSALASKVDASALNNYYTKTEADNLLGDKQDVLTAGSNITIIKDTQTGETVISATGGSGDDTFVAEYNVTTSQELLAYLDSTKEPFAPILVKRGNTYYTAVISTPGADKVNISTFGTISGEGYLFNYTVTGANWSSSNIGFQTKLESGTNIKTINNQSLLGSGNIDIQGGSGTNEILFIHVNEADFTPTTTAGVDSQVLTSPYTVAELIDNASQTQPKELILRIETVSGSNSDYLDVPLSVQGESGYFGGQLFLYEATGDVTGVYIYNIELSGADTVLTRTVKVFDKYAKVGVETVTNPDQSSTVVGAVYDGTNDIRMFVNKDAQGQLADTLNVQLGTQVIPVPLSPSGITVDDALSETSLNPVQNRVIYGALESMRLAMTGYLERLAALETKLADFEEIRLQMTDGTNTVDKTVLAKPYVEPTPQTVFDLDDGVYAADGTFLGALTRGTETTNDIYETNDIIRTVNMTQIMTKYPTAAGMVISGVTMGQNSVTGVTSGQLDWVCLKFTDEIYGPLAEHGTVPDWVSTIYVPATMESPFEPWGLTAATVNKTGTPLPWT